MGKVSPKDGQSNTSKQKRRSKSTKSKYLRPGALAQLRNTKVSAAKCCTDLWKIRVVVTNTDDANKEVLFPNDVNDESPIFLSPMRYGDMDLAKQNYLQMTPKTPRAAEGMLESRLESLPLDLLVLNALFLFLPPNHLVSNFVHYILVNINLLGLQSVNVDVNKSLVSL